MIQSRNALVSIIIPIYRVEKYLNACVDSALNQTYKNLEIILVDDGSTDDCPRICDDYAKMDSRVIVIHKENGGLSDARNAGIEIAKGDYLYFLDSDDYIAPETIEKLYYVLLKTNSDFAGGNHRCIYENGNLYPENEITIKKEILDRDQLLAKLVSGESGKYVIVWNKLFCRRIFDNIRFPFGKIHEDEFVAHRIFYECKQAAFLPEELYFYRRRGDSLTGDKLSVKKMDYCYALADRCTFFHEHEYTMLLNKTFILYWSFLYGEKRKGWRKHNCNVVKAHDELFFQVFTACKSALGFKAKLCGKFPRLARGLLKIKLLLQDRLVRKKQ